MLPIGRVWEGSRSTEGLVSFRQLGLPGDLSDRLPEFEWIYTLPYSRRTVGLSLGVGAVARVEGCFGDPTLTDVDWFTVESVGESSVLFDDSVLNFLRVRVVSGGDVRVVVSGEVG